MELLAWLVHRDLLEQLEPLARLELKALYPELKELLVLLEPLGLLELRG
jgi:hypothetical protein